MDYVMRKKLAAPVKKITSCVTRGKSSNLWSKYRSKRGKAGRSRGTTAQRSSYQDPCITRSYQADLEKARKQREALNAQKNAERAAMRAHFRRKHQLPKNRKDPSRLRKVGGKVVLPRELAAMINPDVPSKEDAYSLLSAFQGLSFNVGFLSGEKRTKTPTPVNKDCKVM